MTDELTGPARLRALITGRVQMVGFRAFAEMCSARHGVTGYVRNLPTGEVEVVAEGDRTLLEEFLAELGRGPRGARVDNVLVSWEPFRGDFADFGVRYGDW
jgi:acylphosphatase